MGAASKGIIQRGYQHNATVYKTPYAKNPFDSVTDDDIKEYKRTVDRKRAGDCKKILNFSFLLNMFNVLSFQTLTQIFRNLKLLVPSRFQDKLLKVLQ